MVNLTYITVKSAPGLVRQDKRGGGGRSSRSILGHQTFELAVDLAATLRFSVALAARSCPVGEFRVLVVESDNSFRDLAPRI